MGKKEKEKQKQVGLPQELKMVVVGDGGVGKSSLTLRFVVEKFIDEYDPTIEDSYRKEVCVGDDQTHIFDILDTAGYEEWGCFNQDRYYYQGEFFFVVFAINYESSYLEAKVFIEKIARIKDGLNAYIMLVGNKKDLEESRKVDTMDAQEYADEKCIPYIEVSAKTGEGVEDMFIGLARHAKDNPFPEESERIQRAANIKRAV
eukprot:CAMPEP_0201513502 /NCGR_PEP_ID=MMETSP0161_2-20130828/5544_1 /ASSEMBLY_ACC=CAM_ASM_000251 /TAXON_ID=180227 /ORGANISM="Neoparamoeba aestuarina, Strain SoJaBio B1-5/56/2" /LENGTH=202 /DNA_ID=CAMNT_0047909739 /DNA_START=104 /DNA_END=712 /DNA_ORIENTATION=+